MDDYAKRVAAIKRFMAESGIDAYDLARITKSLCSCEMCKHFVQHYSKDGVPVDFGHCTRGMPKSRRPSASSCGGWELKENCDE